MKHLSLEKAEELYGRKKDYGKAKSYYDKNPESYKNGDCFNNLVSFMINDRCKSPVLYCYGFVLSGMPHFNGVAVAHGWIETEEVITDITMIADKIRKDAAESFLYLPWKKYTAAEYLDALDKTVYPDVMLKKDAEFIQMIEDMGYKFLG